MDLKDITPHPEKDDATSVGVEHEIREPYEPSPEERIKIQNTIKRYKHYRDKRMTWHQKASEDLDFVNLKQWEDWEEDELTKRGQAPLICDQIYPRVTHLVSQLTANMPEFRVTGVEDSDVRIATIFNYLIQHILYINDFQEKMVDWVRDHAEVGVGALLVEYDPYADYGDGDIKISTIHPFDLYIDPECREKDLSDAERVIIAKMIGKNRALLLVPPEKEDAIRRLTEEGDYENKYISSGKHNEEDVELLDEVVDEDREHLLYIEEYMRVRVPYYIGIDTTGLNSPTPHMNKEQFEAWKEDPAIADGIENGAIEVTEIHKIRVLRRVIIGNVLVGEEILETSRYPIIPLFFNHRRNPYSMGIVRGMKGYQKERNKRRSLMIANAVALNNSKLLYMDGVFDDEEKIEQEWNRPIAAIKINPVAGQKITDNIWMPSPQPLSNAFFTLEMSAKKDMDEYIGIDPLSTGVAEAAPPTAQATLAIDEFGKRRQALYIKNIGFALRRLGKVIIDFIQNYWSEPNIVIRIVNPQTTENEMPTKIILNSPDVEDVFTEGEIAKVGDITTGRYDLVVVEGSTLPSNRWMQARHYMDMYQIGLIDDIEALKKMDVTDREGVIKRKSLLAQLQQQLRQLTEENQRLSQLLTREQTKRLTAEQRTELEKFKARLEGQNAKMQKMMDKMSLQLEAAVEDIRRNGRIKVATNE